MGSQRSQLAATVGVVGGKQEETKAGFTPAAHGLLRIHTSVLVTCRARHYCVVTRKTQDSLTSWTCPRAEVAWLWSLVASGHHTPTPVSPPPGKSCGELST